MIRIDNYIKENNNISKIRVYKALWKQLSKKRKRQIFFLFGLIILAGFAEVITLAAIFPFISMLINPDIIFNISWLKFFLNLLGFKSSQAILLPVTTIFIITVIAAGLIKILVSWLNQRVAVSIGSDLSSKTFSVVINRPYLEHTKDNSSSLITIISQHVSDTVEVIFQTLQLFTGLVIAIFIFSSLLFTNYFAAISAALVFSILYFFIARFSKNNLNKYGNKKTIYKARQIKSLQEGLGGIREILMGGYQKEYISMYEKADFPLRLYDAKIQFLAIYPKYFVETIGIILIVTILLFIISSGRDLNESIPIMATLALGSQKLLPAMQLSFGAFSTIKGNLFAVVKVLRVIDKSPNQIYRDKTKQIKLDRFIQLKNIEFKYSNSSPIVLKNISLRINKGERIGIVGKSGCGKSTLLEIIMGLLQPTSGELFIDNLNITKINNPNILDSWRKSIAYVPQNIYLSDSTILENIAFGIDKENINYDLAKSSAEEANLKEFIESKLYGLDTFVGERGIQLSGGQRQRIGIARALYRRCKIITFDEATSSLDSATEESIIKTIEELSDDLTILIIAHRMSTLKSCDRIIKIENGMILET